MNKPAIVLGLAAAGVALVAASSSSASSSAPPPGGGTVPSGGPPPPPGGGGGPAAPPAPANTSEGGAAFAASLPATSVKGRYQDARDSAILDAVRRRFIRPLTWMTVDASHPSVNASVLVFVSDLPLAIGTPDDWTILGVRNVPAQLIADELDAFLCTSRISDLAWKQASVRLQPHPQTADAQMEDTARMVMHSNAVKSELGGRVGLIRTAGKDWALSNLLVGKPDRCCLFGWHTPSGFYTSPGGVKVIQPLSVTAHDVSQIDYSHTLSLVSRLCMVDGVDTDLGEVLQDPDLSRCVSDEGPLQLLRHPGAPALMV